MKKSQISIYVIFGLVLLIGAFLVFFLNKSYTEIVTDPGVVITQGPQLFPIERYIQFCIEKEAIPIIREFSKKGGSIDNNYFRTLDGKINVLYTQIGSNQLLTNEVARNYIQEKLKPKLDECIDTDEYRRLGYSVREGDKEVFVEIANEDVIINLNYSLRVWKQDTVSFQDFFSEKVNLPLGKLIDFSRDIVNSELQRGFDLDYFRLNNLDYHIEKRMPYPYSVYKIRTKVPEESSRYLEINFAIETADITSLKFSKPELLFPGNFKSDEGSCVIEGKCYSFVKDGICQSKNGDFSLQNTCTLSNNILTQYYLDTLSSQTRVERYIDEKDVHGNICDKYFDVYTGEIVNSEYLSGESWCTYEPGVGGRFYKLSCVEGEVIVEQCRDFKEEICAQDYLNLNDRDFSVAICRPNRYWSCNSCTNEICCSNSDQRDCLWDERLGCFPIFETGMKFWNSLESSQICSNAIVSRTENVFFNSERNSVNCYSMGDCGEKINYLGFFSSGHSQNRENNQAFFKNLIKRQRDEYSKTEFNIGEYVEEFLPRRRVVDIGASFGFIEILNLYLKNIDEVMVYDLDTYLDPQFDIDISSLSAHTCSPWSPLSESRCDLCNIDFNPLDGTTSYSECTEYKCHSLGNDCTFQRTGGSPYCFSPIESDIPLEIVNLRIEDYSVLEEQTRLGSGVLIEDNVRLFNPLRISLDTNKDALCKLSYLPDKSFSEISGSDLTGMEFSKSHTVSITFTHNYDIFERILEYFNKPNYNSLLNTLVDLKFKLDAFIRRFPRIEKFSKGIHPILVPLVDYYLDTSTQDKLEIIFNNLDVGNFIIFFKCLDESGGETQDFYFRFRLDDPCTDTTPPRIVKTIPENEGVTKGEIEIYVNEISECKFDLMDVDFNLMSYDFECDRNPFMVSGIGNGSYRCTADLNEHDIFMIDHDVKIYIRCKDHPYFDRIDDIYNFNLKKMVDYFWFNNRTHEGYDVSVTNTTDLISVDLVDLIRNKNHGEFDLGISYGSQKYISLNFDVPFECFSDEEVSCSSSRCVVRNNFLKDDISLTCRYKLPDCNFYENNVNEEGFEYKLFRRKPLEVTYLAYVNETFILRYIDSEDARTDCGIEIKQNQGYLKMFENEEKNEFRFRYTENRVGGGVAKVICLNKFGDVITKEVDYQFS